VLVHRGDCKSAPENTLPAFASAVRKGAHQIEFDVRLSRDGVPVIMHDATVDRTTDGAGRVAELTFRELRRLDAGSWFAPRFKGARIPTLRETLEIIPREILCNVHLANVPGVAERAARLIVEMGRAEQCVLACTREQAARARAIARGIRICNMSGPRRDLRAYVQETIDARAEFIQVLSGLDGLPEAVRTLHDHGVTVNYYSAQEEEFIRQLVRAGVDYILTDDLDLCLRVLAGYGVRPASVSPAQSGVPLM
jgi:glycerophosphoryl diester phosphodiesterase